MKRIVFCGFGKLGSECLKALHKSNLSVIFIFTHKELKKDSVDTFAKENSIDFSYFDMRKEPEFALDVIEKVQPDFLVSINYRYIIPVIIFSKAKYAINIHGSLLPKYRGRTPHVWSIINGEEYSGITCHFIEELVDSGDIIEQQKIFIDKNDTGFMLLQKFEHAYPDLLLSSISHLGNKENLIKQNPEDATYYGKRIPEMGYIDFHRDALEVKNFVRAQAFPYPGAYFYLIDGRKIIINRIIETSFQFDASIGQIKLIDGKPFTKCKNSNLEILDYEINEV